MPPATDQTPEAATASHAPVFHFRRMGGLDQALMLTDDEWRHLRELDPKIWMALSCPTQGLEYDAQTLALLDADKDGRIRAADIIAAADWVCARVKRPALLNQGGDLPLDNIRDDCPEGAAIKAAAQLATGETAASIGAAAATAAVAKASGYAFNGDGILPPASITCPECPGGAPAGAAGVAPEQVAGFIKTGLAVVGGKRDASGKPGLDDSLAKEFCARLTATRDWRERLASLELPLGEGTSEAWSLLQRLGGKIDDYFARCHLAQFAPQTLGRLNDDAILASAAAEDNPAPFSPSRLAELPLARVAINEGGASETVSLPLAGAVNPAWSADLAAFSRLFAPLMPQDAKGLSPALAEKTWRQIQERFAPYAALLEAEPSYSAPPEDAERIKWPDAPELALAPADDALGRAFLPLDPLAALKDISDEELARLLDENLMRAFAAWTAKDRAAPSLDALRDLEKLTLLQANFYTLLMNFVSFADFYDPHKRAIFQAGTLYLDSRACYLCVPVQDVDTHVQLAAPSHLCLIYCACQRKDADGAEQQASIAAALTAGSAAALMDGRHGLFVDNAGRDWDTRILRIIHNPVSLREAMWAPYIRFATLVGEQVRKFVASKEEAVSNATAQTAGSLVQTAVNPKAPAPAAPPAPQPEKSFDFAKGAGIFAALSVALSVLSAAFAYIAKSVASLGWWWPLALLGIFICISGPSMLLAWFKLRKRSLGPLLDASGWAVNNGAPINMIMGMALTGVGVMPHAYQRDSNDPYGLPARLQSARRWRRFWLLLLLLLALCGVGLALYCQMLGAPHWLLSLLTQLGIKA